MGTWLETFRLRSQNKSPRLIRGRCRGNLPAASWQRVDDGLLPECESTESGFCAKGVVSAITLEDSVRECIGNNTMVVTKLVA